MSSNTETALKSATGTVSLVDVKRADDGVVIATLNNPKARNALSKAMMQALLDEISNAASDPHVRVVVIAANGPAFCAGHDLKELTAHRSDDDNGVAFFSDTMQRCSQLMQAIVACPKPVIAAVHATATAAGCQLVATCDLVVAAHSAKFCTPGVNIGLFCSTPMVALSRNVARKRAMEMLLLGDMLSADDAASIGLVNRVVADGDALSEALNFANKIAEKSARTVAIGKTAFYQQIDMPLADAYDYAADVMVKNMMTEDAKEGISAFLDKRRPTWRGT